MDVNSKADKFCGKANFWSHYFTGKRVVSIVVFAALFIYVFWFSANALWLGDDINYQFMFDKDTGSTIDRVETVSDVFKSQYNHYFVGNGRVVAHTVVQFINPFVGKSVFAVLNGLAYILFVFLVVKLGFKFRGTGGKYCVTDHPLAIAFVTLMTLFSLALKFVPTTAMYIWMFDIILIFLYVLLFALPRSNWWVLPLFLFGVIAGNGHEAMTIGLAIGLCIYGFQRIRKLKLNEYAMLIGFAVGVLLIVLSPASRERLETQEISWIKVVITVIYMRAIFVLAITIISVVRSHSQKLLKLYKDNSLLVNSILGGIIFCIVILNTGSRPLYGPETFAMIMTISIWSFVRNPKRKAVVGIIVILAILGYKTDANVRSILNATPKYVKIKEKFAKSEDGTVEMESVSGHGAMQRVAGYILGGVQDGLFGEDEGSRLWQTMNLTKLFNHEFGTHKTLRYVIPLEREILTMPDSTQVLETQPGNYYIIISKANPPKRVVAHRSALWGLKSWSDAQIYPSDDKPDFETSTLEAYAMFDQMYFVGIDSVEIEW